MRLKIQFLILICSVASTAWAVSKGNGGAGVSEPVEESGPVSMHLDIPVTWQVTRARIEANGVRAETESFRETWTLVFQPGSYSTLKSPRGEAPVFAGRKRLGGGIPANIMLAEREFARLIGLDRHMADLEAAADEGDAAAREGQMVTLSLQESSEGASLTLHLSPEEHVAVQLSLGDFSTL